MRFWIKNSFELDKKKYSWFARYIQFPIVVYLAKRAFKRNRLDTFIKWMKRLPNHCHFVLNSETQDTFHHYLAQKTFLKHVQANKKIRAKRKTRSSWPMTLLKVIISNFQRQREIQVRNRHRAEAVFYIRFFLNLTYSPKFQSLFPSSIAPENALSQEVAEAELERIAKAAMSEKTQTELEDISTLLLEKGTRLQKAKAAFKLLKYAKAAHFINAALHGHAQKNQQRQTPERIFFQIFSKEMPDKSALKSKGDDLGLVSHESSQRLSPYDMILREIQKYMGAEDEKKMPPKPTQTPLPHTPENHTAFDGWLFPHALEVNLTQQNQQEQSMEYQQQQEQNIQVNTNVATLVHIAPQEVRKSEMRFTVRIDKTGKIVGFLYEAPSTYKTTLNQTVQDYFSLPDTSQFSTDGVVRHQNYFGADVIFDCEGNAVRYASKWAKFSPSRAAHQERIQTWLQSFINKAVQDHKEIFEHVMHVDDEQSFVIHVDNALLNAMDYKDTLHIPAHEIAFTKEISKWANIKPMLHERTHEFRGPLAPLEDIITTLKPAYLHLNFGTIVKDETGSDKKEIEAAQRGKAYDLVMTVRAKPAAQVEATPSTQISIDAYTFLSADVKAWLKTQFSNPAQEPGWSKIMAHAIEECSEDDEDPLYHFKYPNKTDHEILKKNQGGREKFLQIIRHLLENHQNIGDEKLNQLFVRLQKLDEVMMTCKPLLFETDHYSLLSFFNDYVFQKMLQHNGEFGLKEVSDYLLSDLFSAIADELLSQDETVYSSLFGLIFSTMPDLTLSVRFPGRFVTHNAQLKPITDRVIGGQFLMNEHLPRFLNNCRYLKKNNLWDRCVRLSHLQKDVIHVLSAYVVPSEIIWPGQHVNAFATYEELLLMMFYMDLSERSPVEIEDMFENIEKPVFGKKSRSETEKNPKKMINIHMNQETAETSQKMHENIFYAVMRFVPFKFLNPFLVDFDFHHPKPSDVSIAAFDAHCGSSTFDLKADFFTVVNHFPRHCRYGEIRAFVEALALNVFSEKYETLRVAHQLMRLMVRYVQNPAIQSEPFFWKKLLEKYEPYLKAETVNWALEAQLKKEVDAEIALYDAGNFSALEAYVKSAAIAAQQNRVQLPVAGMDAFMWLTLHGELSEEELFQAIELRKALDDLAHQHNRRKKDKRTALERAKDFQATLQAQKEKLPLNEQQLLYRLEFAEAYEVFKRVRASQNDAVKAGTITSSAAAETITNAAKVLEDSSSFQWLNRYMSEKNAQVQLERKMFELLRAACEETKNLPIEGLKQYIKDNGLYDVKETVNETKQYQFLASMIRMFELSSVGVPTQPQLYVALQHLQRLRAYKADEESVMLYQLSSGEGKTLMQYMTGMLDKLFQIRADHMTPQRDLAKTGACEIQTMAQAFFGIKVRDLYRQTEQENLTPDEPKAASLEEFQQNTLAHSDIVYLDVYDNMLQMAKAIHLHEGPRFNVGREAGHTHLSIDEVDHLLEISAKVTAHIAELEKDPNTLLMLKDFYRALNCTMAQLLSQDGLAQLEACGDSDKKRALSKKWLLKEASGKPEVIQYIESLSSTLLDGWMNSALTVHTRLKHERNRLYTFETEKRDERDVQVLYIALKDTSGKILRDAQWSAGVHQLLSDYWLHEQQEKRDTTTKPYFIPPLSHTVLHTSVELLVQPYHFITGVTATLGSKEDIETLQAMFPGKKITIVRLPRATPDRRFDYGPLVVLQESLLEQKYRIFEKSIEQKEPLLIRFETIQEVEDFQTYCLKRNPKMVPYLLDDKRRTDAPVNENFVIRTLADGGAAVITNAGSRGTNFKNIKRFSNRPGGTRATHQAKARAARFGAFGITQDLVSVEELGLTLRVLPAKQQQKLLKPLKQGSLESTMHFEKRLNQQRAKQQQAHVMLFKKEMALQQSMEKKKKVKAKDISLRDKTTGHIEFAIPHVKLFQEKIDHTINTQSQNKMRNNFFIDAIQSAVMPVLHLKKENDPMRVEWRQSCLPEVQSQILRRQPDEAIAVFKRFADKHQMDVTQSLKGIQQLRMEEPAKSTLKPLR